MGDAMYMGTDIENEVQIVVELEWDRNVQIIGARKSEEGMLRWQMQKMETSDFADRGSEDVLG